MKMAGNNLRLALACAGLVLFGAATARAQENVRYIASAGNDANPCTRTAPCRSMQRGVNATPAGGLLQVVDSAGYGPNVTITQAITVSARGVSATVITPVGVGITVNAPGARVVLRGLTLNGAGTGTDGIVATAAASLHVEDCAAERFVGDGIRFGADGELYLRNVSARGNGNNGLEVTAGTGSARVTVSRSRFQNNGGDGINFASGTIEAAVAETVASGNAVSGFAAGGVAEAGILVRAHFEQCTAAQNTMSGFQSFATASMTVERSEARGNGASGMATGGTGQMLVSNSVATHNATGFNSAGGLFRSRTNNTVSGNTVNVVGVVIPLGGV